MFLKSLSIENFRKFGTENNIVHFAAAKDYKTEEYLNIAPKVTLIVGKNNSGKTTVIEALKRLLSPTAFCATDFNFEYLNKLLSRYTQAKIASRKVKLPTMTFLLKIGMDNDDPDLLTNIVPFISLGNVEKSEVVIKAVWEPEDDDLFLQALTQFIKNKRKYKDQAFPRFLNLLDEQKYTLNFYNQSNVRCDSFQLRRLVELEPIAANTVLSDDCLSAAFAKIVDYRYQRAKDAITLSELDKEILSINSQLTKYFMSAHGQPVNDSLGRIFASDKCQVLLRSDLTFQKLLRTVLKYEYVEGNSHIPEHQFGLGYTNLMMIVASIISYIEKYPERAFNSQINLVTIEEPETFMHPQMQELFIRDVNQMIDVLLENHDKHVNSQIIITTHSAHILNSKIQEGNSFSSINYITELDHLACAVSLDDQTIFPQTENKYDMDHSTALRYIKKHITFGVSQLFFADAAIFVEGISEYVLLRQYLSLNANLKTKYISVVMINGAFAHVYQHLISTLRIPVIVITDIDFQRTDQEKKDRIQMTASLLNNRKTTNHALISYFGTDSVHQLLVADHRIANRIMVVYQKQAIKGYYATSFEEAYVLSNCDNTIVKDVLKQTIPRNYKKSVENGGLENNSYRIQCALIDKKSDFADMMLFKMILAETEDSLPKLPQYIEDGLTFLVQELGDS